MNGLVGHFLLTLRLNFRSKQALVYGYLVPIFFLLSFGSVFRSSVPPLVHEMGQLLTITVLGGACFGMPTSIVSERERGIWRRYRLLPAAMGSLIVSTMLARYVIVLIAATLQVTLAWCLYRTPWPARPLESLVAFTFVSYAFLGLGLIIAMVAETVPAVQALGQAIFLPMIMVGGVGVPLRTLPTWAQHLAAFMPGRYAVEVLQACLEPAGVGLAGVRFSLAVLLLIGAASCVFGARLFRWDAGPRSSRAAAGWLLLAVLVWAAVGAASEWRSRRASEKISARTAALLPATTGTASCAHWGEITDADINAITFDDLPPDIGVVVPLASSLDGLETADAARVSTLLTKLDDWPPGLEPDPVQRARNFLSVAAVADILQDSAEGEIAYVVLEHLKTALPAASLKKTLGCIILHPEEGAILTKAPDLGLGSEVGNETELRERIRLYAKKLLAEMLGHRQRAAP